jgi:uncharacterized protein YjeT (DUF2065 family)
MTNLERLEKLAIRRDELAMELHYRLVMRALAATTYRIGLTLNVFLGTWGLVISNETIEAIGIACCLVWIVDSFSIKMFDGQIKRTRAQIASVNEEILRLPKG